MKNGILFLAQTYNEHTIQELTLPIFHEDRELVNSILTDAMNVWLHLETKNSLWPHVGFFNTVESLGRKRTKSQVFIGPESTYETLDSVIKNRPYVFTVDFNEGKIIKLK